MLTEPDALGVLDELAVDELEVDAELDDELLHPAMARPVHAIAARATTGARLFAKTEIILRTLPLLVALRKQTRHDCDLLGAICYQTEPPERR
jgi:hypothetical protein